MDEALKADENEGAVDAASSTPPEAKIVSDTPRSKVEPLDWPVSYDGKIWKEIPISRCSGEEIDKYIEQMNEGTAEIPPCIRCPLEVWKAMDDDDRYRIEEVADKDFLPQRLRDMAERLQQITEQSSGS